MLTFETIKNYVLQYSGISNQNNHILKPILKCYGKAVALSRTASISVALNYARTTRNNFPQNERISITWTSLLFQKIKRSHSSWLVVFAARIEASILRSLKMVTSIIRTPRVAATSTASSGWHHRRHHAGLILTIRRNLLPIAIRSIAVSIVL